MLDPTLNYYENQSAIAETIGGPLSAEEREQYKAYMDKIAEEAKPELENIEQLTTRNNQLEQLNKKLKAKEMETLDSRQIKDEIHQILNQLSVLPNLHAQIEAQ